MAPCMVLFLLPLEPDVGNLADRQPLAKDCWPFDGLTGCGGVVRRAEASGRPS